MRLDGQYVMDKEPDKREKVRAIAAWDAQDEFQLSFDEGEVITVLDKFQGNAMYDGTSPCPSFLRTCVFHRFVSFIICCVI